MMILGSDMWGKFYSCLSCGFLIDLIKETSALPIPPMETVSSHASWTAYTTGSKAEMGDHVTLTAPKGHIGHSAVVIGVIRRQYGSHATRAYKLECSCGKRIGIQPSGSILSEEEGKGGGT